MIFLKLVSRILKWVSRILNPFRKTEDLNLAVQKNLQESGQFGKAFTANKTLPYLPQKFLQKYIHEKYLIKGNIYYAM